MIEPAAGAHIGDDAHIRFLDGESDESERTALAGHVARCARCAGRLAELRERAAAVSRLLDEADVAPRVVAVPTRHRGPRRVRFLAVAAAVVLAVVVAAASPVQAWIIERSLQLWSLVNGGLGPPSPAPSQPRTDQVERFVSVSFAVEGSRLTVEVVRLQPEGVVVVEVVETATASAAITEGESAADLVVLPGRLRIANAPESTASYRIRVPSTLSWVEVLVDGQHAAGFDPRRARENRIVDLASPQDPR